MTKFKPMLASAINSPHDLRFPLYASPKFDGIRCIVKDGQVLSRTLKPIPNKYVRDTLSKLSIPQFPGHTKPDGLDGELMIDGDFNEISSAIMTEDGEPKFTYIIFDVITDEVFEDRRAILLKLHDYFIKHSFITVNSGVPISNIEEAVKFDKNCIDKGFEGSMFRCPEGLYKYGRSTINEGYLLKYKHFLQEEAQCIGMIEQMTNNNPKKKNALGRTERSTNKENMIPADTLGALKVRFNNIEFELGTGFNDDDRKHIWMHKKDYIDKIVTFKYQELSKDGVPRFPVFIGWRHREDL